MWIDQGPNCLLAMGKSCKKAKIIQESFIFLFVMALTEGKISGFSNYLAEWRKELDRIGDLKRS